MNATNTAHALSVAASKQPVGLLPGIYFGLPEEDYHDDYALSASGMKRLLKDPFYYWKKSPLNPNSRFSEASEAKKRGKVFHTLLLEPDEFKKRYFISPGEPWDMPNRQLCKRYEFHEAMDCLEYLMELDEIAGLFKEGYSEVSLVWRCPLTGILKRGRTDYIRMAGGVPIISDYKTARSTEYTQLGYDIDGFGYDIQNSMYVEGVEEIRRMLRAKTCKAYGNVDKKFLKKFMDSESAAFTFVFQETKEPFMPRAEQLPPHWVIAGHQKSMEATEIYSTNMAAHGPDKCWPSNRNRIGTFPETHIPNRTFHH